MGSEAAQQYLYSQGVYYTAPSYYGYNSTGIEAPGKFGGHVGFGGEGQDLIYPGLQSDGTSYSIYYSPPDCGYVSSSFNNYPTDNSLAGAQPYIANAVYDQSTISPYVFPLAVQSGIGGIPINPVEPSLASSFPYATYNLCLDAVKELNPLASPFTNSASQRAVMPNMPLRSTVVPSKPFSDSAKLLKGPFPMKQYAANTATFPRVNQASEPLLPACIPFIEQDKSKVNSASTQDALDLHTWAKAEKFLPSSMLSNNINGIGRKPAFLNDQYPSGRSNGARVQQAAPITVKSYTSTRRVGDPQGNIIINPDQYNRSDFVVEYPYAKFFVIKSYSEDDVHKSIKYGVWSSTANGNKKLDGAYEDARRLAVRNSIKCPLFLFFSVNGSGNFCGVAEMVGPVDFQKDMDFWLQDKWPGSFPVKWLIVKDVSNTCLRQILLENNENRPVTHSRDTQEIPYIQGTTMLRIFKNTAAKESILDEFMKYEELEKSRRMPSKLSLDAPVFIPSYVHADNLGAVQQARNTGSAIIASGLRQAVVAAEQRQEGNSNLSVPPNGTHQSPVNHVIAGNGEENIPKLLCKSDGDKATVADPKLSGVDTDSLSGSDQSESVKIKDDDHDNLQNAGGSVEVLVVTQPTTVATPDVVGMLPPSGKSPSKPAEISSAKIFANSVNQQPKADGTVSRGLKVTATDQPHTVRKPNEPLSVLKTAVASSLENKKELASALTRPGLAGPLVKRPQENYKEVITPLKPVQANGSGKEPLREKQQANGLVYRPVMNRRAVQPGSGDAEPSVMQGDAIPQPGQTGEATRSGACSPSTGPSSTGSQSAEDNEHVQGQADVVTIGSMPVRVNKPATKLS